MPRTKYLIVMEFALQFSGQFVFLSDSETARQVKMNYTAPAYIRYDVKTKPVRQVHVLNGSRTRRRCLSYS